jgi:alkylation response protein AidB-like acyl-CoA dehydrogenase
MDFSFSEEQMMLKDSFKRFLKDGYPFDKYRKTLSTPSGHDTAIWQQFAELQWQGLPFSEAAGGLGYGHIELLLLAEEMGQGLCIEPYMANVVLAGQMIATLGSDAQKAELLPALISGAKQISLAHTEVAGRYDLAWCECAATPQDDQSGQGDQGDQGGNWQLSGRKSMVLNAPNAQQILVLARTHGSLDSHEGLGVFLIERDQAGVSMRKHAALGGGVAAELRLDKVSAQRLGGEAFTALEDVVDLATAYNCAEAYGAMQALLAKTVEYSKTRKQFGMPLGAFQVLQHRMVDMFVEVQQSQSMILMLMLRLQEKDRSERQKAVSACKAYLHKSSKFVAQQAVQLHGGIGVTEELDIGHYFRRLTAFGTMFGDRLHHLRRFAALGQQAQTNQSELASAA